MSRYQKLNIDFAQAICYSGYRDGQSPDAGIYPSYEEVKEDLLLLQGHWKYLRLYDCGPHPQTVLEVIRREELDFKVMLGAYITAEVSNPNCPWGGVYGEEELALNKAENDKEIDRLISLANHYQDEVIALSVGNEATVDWTDHLVPVEQVIAYVEKVKAATKQPVSFCENYLPWLDKLKPLAAVVDFISIHTYPVWEYKTIDQGLAFTKENFEVVANAYPDVPVMITEAGWATNSNGRGIPPENVNEELQEIYFHQIQEWTEQEGIICFYFEAFDENWKGSPDALEPEKHWGLYRSNREAKKVLQAAKA